MNPTIPSEVAKTIQRLRSEAKEKLRLADELERNYSGSDPTQAPLPGIDTGEGLLPRSALIEEATVENLVRRVRQKSARVAVLAQQFQVTETKIKELVSASGGKLFIPDWRGWVKIKSK